MQSPCLGWHFPSTTPSKQFPENNATAFAMQKRHWGPVGVNLAGYNRLGPQHVLQRCDLSNVRILISQDIPPVPFESMPNLLLLDLSGSR